MATTVYLAERDLIIAGQAYRANDPIDTRQLPPRKVQQLADHRRIRPAAPSPTQTASA